MLSVIYTECLKLGHYAQCCYAECHYAECLKLGHYAQCCYAECHYAECHNAECRHAECRGAVQKFFLRKTRYLTAENLTVV